MFFIRNRRLFSFAHGYLRFESINHKDIIFKFPYLNSLDDVLTIGCGKFAKECCKQFG